MADHEKVVGLHEKLTAEYNGTLERIQEVKQGLSEVPSVSSLLEMQKMKKTNETDLATLKIQLVSVRNSLTSITETFETALGAMRADKSVSGVYEKDSVIRELERVNAGLQSGM